MTHDKKLVNEKEAAANLGLAVQTLRNWRFRGCGPEWVRLGRAVRYDPSVIDAYIERHRIRVHQNAQ